MDANFASSKHLQEQSMAGDQVGTVQLLSYSRSTLEPNPQLVSRAEDHQSAQQKQGISI